MVWDIRGNGALRRLITAGSRDIQNQSHTESYGDLIEKIYAGAAAPSHLREALSSVVARLGASGGNIHVVDRSNAASLMFVASGANYSDASIEAYFKHWRRFNPYRAAMRRAGEVFLCHEHFCDGSLSHSAYAQEFYFAMGERWLAGAVANVGENYEVSVAFNRGADRAQFAAKEGALIGLLAPHMRRAAKLSVDHALNAALGHSLAEALSASARPAFMVDGAQRVIWMNKAGEDLAAARGPIKVRHGKLQLSEASASERFARAVAVAVSRGLEREGVAAIACEHEGVALDLDVMPASTPDQAMRGVKALALVLGRVRGLGANAGDVLKARFGLTPIEQRLAIEIAHGGTLEEIAERRGVSVETVRTQVRSVFSKTQTGRQGELVALVWRMCSM